MYQKENCQVTPVQNEENPTMPTPRIREEDRQDVVVREEEIYGDSLTTKQADVIRLVFMNINSIPALNDNPKNAMLYQSIVESEANIVGLSETNRNWYKVDSNHKWHDRIKSWFETSHTSMVHNVKDVESENYQPGGNLLLSINKAAHRVFATDKDPTGLGRWTSTVYRGKRNIKLRVIVAYRPCRSSGPNSSYMQQQRFFDVTGRGICPRRALLDDLGDSIKYHHAQGEQIVLMMDCNTDIQETQFRSWLQEIGLEDGIMDHEHPIMPATYHRGSKPIDGIFMSPSLQATKKGFLQFGFFPSDHRALWLDLTLQNAFGGNTCALIPPVARKLKLDDVRTSKRWKDLYQQYIIDHNLHTKIFQLESEITGQLTLAQQRKYEAIIKKREQGIRYADKRCRKKRMGAVPFSVELNQRRLELELWKAVETKKSGCVYSWTKLRRLIKKVGIGNPMQLSLEEVKMKVKEAYSAYYATKKNSKKLRLTFLEEKARDLAAEKNLQTENVYNQLIQREKVRTAARKVKFVLGKTRKGGVTRVEVERNGEIHEITDSEEIYQVCAAENEKKYQQTRNTPCLQPPLRELLGFDGLTQFANDILDGTFVAPQGTSQYLIELFQQLKKPDNINLDQIATEVTVEQFQNGWKGMKEFTSAGKSGLHFGHLKLCALHTFLANFESSISHIPFATGYSPRVWRVGVMVMIHKKALVDLVTKLRTIVLTEADFNFNNKLLGKLTMEHAERHNLIAQEQFGSRKGKTAIDQALHKCLMYDTLRLTRKPGALCSNDARSCYDRILHSIAMLAFRRLGISSPSVECMIKTIRNMHHHIRTRHGDSVFTLHCDGSLIPFQGVLQGNGAAPAIWVIISTPLLNMLRAAGNGAKFTAPISKASNLVVAFAFVDDTDLIAYNINGESTTCEEIMAMMQQSIDRWEGGLKGTGGAINPDDTWVYPINFIFNDKGEWEYETVESIGAEFSVLDHNNTRTQLDQHEASTGKSTLGVFLAPDGNNTAALEHLMKKAKHWSDLIRAGHLERKEAWQAVETTIMKTLEYPLPALTLTEKECDKIMRHVLSASLNKTSISRNFPRKAVYGPLEEGGLGLHNLYTTQGLSHISKLQEHLGAPTITGHIIRTNIEMCKLHLGIGRNIFSLDYHKYSILLPDCWIKHTWKFAFDNNILIHDNVTDQIPLTRENDIFLMEAFVNEGFSGINLVRINRCRLFLQVNTLADVIIGYGDDYCKQTYQGHRDATRTSNFIWPTQPRPDNKSIKMWRRALRKCFPKRQGRCTYTLGKWLFMDIPHWKWYYHPPSQRVFEKFGRIWRIWERCSNRGILGNKPKYKYLCNAINAPTIKYQATIDKVTGNRIQLTGWSQHNQQRYSTACTKNTPDDILQSRYEPADQLQHLINSLQHSSVTVVSDGSYYKEHEIGAAGWIIENAEGTGQCHGTTPTPGPSSSQSSYRSELTGILASVCHVNQICQEQNIINGSASLYCDGEGAVKAAEEKYEITHNNRLHFDLIQSIHIAIKTSPIKWTLHHIKGHQDSNTRYNDLSRIAQLNVEADSLAKDTARRIIDNQDNPDIHQALPFEHCEVWVNTAEEGTIKVYSELTKSLRRIIHTKSIRTYWEKKGKFPRGGARRVDWKLKQKSHKGFSKGLNRWLCKHCTGFCGVGKKLKEYNFQSHSDCPRCGRAQESAAHVIRCRQSEACDLWDDQLNKLYAWMIASEIQPDMAQSIKDNLLAWKYGFEAPQEYPTNQILTQAIRAQHRIGWQQFLEGFWSVHWQECQTAHLQEIKSQKSAALWMSKTQRKIWMIAWELWQDRNNCLHNKNKSTHPTVQNAMKSEITAQWAEGLSTLPARYSHLFQGTLEAKLKTDSYHQRIWLHTVWAARHRINSTYFETNPSMCDQTLRQSFNHWKAKSNT